MVKYIQYKIYHFNHFLVTILWCWVYSFCCTTIITICPQNFLVIPNKILSPLNTNSSSSLPQPLVTSNLLSISMKLMTLDTLYKWHRTVFVLLWLQACVRIFFLEFNIPLNDTAHFAIRLSTRQQGSFHLLAVVNNVAMSVGEQISLWDPAFSFWVHTRKGNYWIIW